MKQILAIDIGTGTQDVFLLRPGLSPENGFKLVMPSPTMRVRKLIQQATSRREAILLTGVTMGGGPCQWAAEAHRKAGLEVFATPDAARTFNDDLDWVEVEMGITIISTDEAARKGDCLRIEMRDLDLDALTSAFYAFGVDLAPDLLALAVFDHGAAPPDVSDRKFRFDLIARQLRSSTQLAAFGYRGGEVPAEYTRMLALQTTAQDLACPKLFMDTAPAAVLGATLDPVVNRFNSKMIANIGNYHTLAFRLGTEGIEGVFEHHTGLLNRESLEGLLQELAAGTLSGEMVFQDQGHGALMLNTDSMLQSDDGPGVYVTGPRRSMLLGSMMQPYLAVPLGDMMLCGCFGLLLAAAELYPDYRMLILDSLGGKIADNAPWDV